MASLRESRMAAAAAGQVKFNTGKPCKFGHFSDRYTSTGACLMCLNLKVVRVTAISRELVSWQPDVQQIAHDMLPQLRDVLNDVISEAVERWHVDMGMATQGRLDAWGRLRFGRAQKAKLVNYQREHSQTALPAVPVAPTATREQLFFNRLAVATGADLDKMTLLQRTTGEPDAAFRERIMEKTRENLKV